AIIWAIINTVAVSYGSTAALPFKTVAIILGLYLVISFPLLLLGAITGKNFTKGFEAPCRTKKVPREIPPVAWYKDENLMSIVSGFLPFISIYIELHYLYLSMWGQYGHVPFPIVLMVVLILIAVTSCITISLIYLTLSQENHNWWWRSIKFGGTSSIFVFGYSLYYYIMESGMSGTLQTTFFVGYNLVIAFAVFLMMSTVGFLSSLTFVKNIYSSIKCE
ncbi:syntaxin SYP111, partial [Naegleria gruberi]